MRFKKLESSRKGAKNLSISPPERDVLRPLAERVAEIAALPEQKEKQELWSRLNGLSAVRPMVHIYQIPWRELQLMEPDALALHCEDAYCKGIETQLRQTIYQWENFPGDMVVEPLFRKEPVLRGDDLGVRVEEETIAQHGSLSIESGIRSHHYIPQLTDESDVEKILIPTITHDQAATDAQTQVLEEAFGDVLPVKTEIRFGRYNISPWDRLVQWTGVEPILMDLALRPEFVHALMERMTAAYEARLDAYADLGLLALNNTSEIVGQGGPGYVDELPSDDYDPEAIGYHNLWGGGMVQIFSEVSPDMHREFALQYEARCLKRFPIVYYGCCEPLHLKVDVIREMLPNVRKISMSPKADDRIGGEALGDTLVFSSKPNPAYLATDVWRPEAVRDELTGILDVSAKQGCHVELILKDISTIRCEPKRLAEWSAVALEVAEEYTR